MPELECSIDVLPKQTPDSPSQLRVTLNNVGETPAMIVTSSLPFAHPEREYFHLEYGGAAVDFWGITPKLVRPTQADAIGLDPGEDIQAVYSVSAYYHLDQAGKYTIAVQDPSVLVFTSEGPRPLALTCSDVILNVAEPEPEPAAKTARLIEMNKAWAKSSAFSNCTGDQVAIILRAEQIAEYTLPIALGTDPDGRSQVASDSKYYAEWFGAHTTSRANKVDNKLEKIANRLTEGLGSGEVYKCHDDNNFCDGAYAWAIPDALGGNRVHLCQSFFNQSDIGFDSRPGILIHEFTHLYGALVGHHAAWVPGAHALALSDPNKAVKNPDSYEYFIEDIYMGMRPRHDVHGDGHSDLVSALGGNAYVYFGKTDHTFGSSTASFAGTLDSALWDGTGHWLLDVVDMNRDGRDDLVSVTAGGAVYVYYGSAAGAFSTGAVSPGIQFGSPLNLVFDDGLGYEPIGLADTDGDPGLDDDFDPDLVAIRDDGAVCQWSGSSTGILSTTPTCTLGLVDSAFVDGVGQHAIDLADVDGDRLADLITADDGGTVFVYTGNADGSFDAGVGSFAGTYDLALYDGVGHEPIAVADVTGDGRADLVTHFHSSGNTYVYPGQADGTFGPGVPSFAGTMNSSLFDGTGHELIGVFDVDGNGLADLVTSHTSGNAYVYPGTAAGSFGFSSASFAGTLDSQRFDGIGHEFISEHRQHRRRGCTLTGCI